MLLVAALLFLHPLSVLVCGRRINARGHTVQRTSFCDRGRWNLNPQRRPQLRPFFLFFFSLLVLLAFRHECRTSRARTQTHKHTQKTSNKQKKTLTPARHHHGEQQVHHPANQRMGARPASLGPQHHKAPRCRHRQRDRFLAQPARNAL